jgi:lysophospholipase L1-like esterase
LGDSITDGVGVTGGGGYRIDLFRMAVEAGFDITFVGTFSNGPNTVAGETFPKNHEGVSGETIAQIHNRVRTQALRDNPNIILLHAGTNDMWSGPSGASDRLGSLLDDLATRAPDALVVVSNIIPWPQMASNVNQYNSQIAGVIDQRINQGRNIVFVDQNSGFPSGELADGIHPNAQGYARMAAKWYDAIYEHLVDID